MANDAFETTLSLIKLINLLGKAGGAREMDIPVAALVYPCDETRTAQCAQSTPILNKLNFPSLFSDLGLRAAQVMVVGLQFSLNL